MSKVPLSVYWQGDGTPMFHPMHVGRWLFNNPTLANYKAVKKLGKKLPNKGLAWYYPNTYDLARMKGRSMYSCIAQAEILAAFCNLERHGIISKEDIVPVFESFKYESVGGINYRDILLELPLEHNYPEVILNGWLHAIVRLISYYKLYNISDPLLDNTLKQLEARLPDFDYPTHKLSKYSNLSPYQIKVTGDKNGFSVVYDDRLYKVRAKHSNNIYDIQWWSENLLIVGISAMSAVILRNDSPFSITIRTGEYCDNRAVPLSNGEAIVLHSEEKEKHEIRIPTDKLFTGYPTNFIKQGVNYYHVHHIVALDIINKYHSSEVFKHYIDLWTSYINDRAFESVEKVKRDINKTML